MKKLALILIVLLTACATPVKKQDDLLQSKTICCTDYSHFNYSKLGETKTIKFKHDPASSVFDFGRGKSYFTAIEIQPELINANVQVKSFFNGGFIGQYFKPSFLMLNEQFAEITRLPVELTFHDANLFNGNDAHLLGGFRVPADTKYIVVFDERLNHREPFVQLNGGGSLQLEKAPSGVVELVFY